MGYATSKDGTKIFYKDWGIGSPVVFSHGWPLNGDVWDPQMHFMASEGFRAVAHHRRGHGASSQPWDGNTMDDYADDLAAVIETLDLRDVVLVGSSFGGWLAAEIATKSIERLSSVVMIGALGVKLGARDQADVVDVFATPRKRWEELSFHDPKFAQRDYDAMNRSCGSHASPLRGQPWLNTTGLPLPQSL